jgi:hypothetical protein
MAKNPATPHKQPYSLVIFSSWQKIQPHHTNNNTTELSHVFHHGEIKHPATLHKQPHSLVMFFIMAKNSDTSNKQPYSLVTYFITAKTPLH